MSHNHTVVARRPTMFFALSLVSLLVACGGSGSQSDSDATGNETTASNGGANAPGAAEPILGTPPSEIRPSISAAQLFADGSNSVTFAQGVAADVYELPDEAQAGNTSQSAVQNPAPDADSQTPLPTTPSPEAPAVQPEPVPAPTAPTEPTQPETAATPVATPAAPTQDASGPRETSFTGSNTPSFSGELQANNTVQLDWDVDPGARGYNVYRDAEYIATVFENTYLDDFTPFDQSYYYEIQAFDFNEQYSTVATGLTVNVTGTGRIDPNAPKVDEDLLKNYELVFSDEFNGTTLDSSKWNTAYLWGDELIINSELQHYVDINNDPNFGFNPFTFDGESLTINTIPTPDNLIAKANGQRYLSGVITSYDAFKFTYGYVEARVQVPVGKGYWPAFWLLNAYYDRDKPEIDIMEFIGDNQDTAYHTYHYYDAAGELRSSKSEPTFPIDYSADFHTFGVKWQPGQVTFYVDGIARHTIKDPKMSQEEMYIIANTAIGGWWPGDPDETTPFPGKYKIDYIRAYQLVGVQQDQPQFENPESQIPVRGPGSQSSPSHLPPFELWPNGYPERPQP